MLKVYHFALLLCLSCICSTGSAQTTLYPGDIEILGVATDIGSCLQTPESDEISFVCYQDIQTGTVFDLTDNGWETGAPGFWGDTEGVLRITRLGGTVPAGTVMTIRGYNNAGTWTYAVLSLGIVWSVTQINTPGGPFNLEPGGDQLYFMQGGNWVNSGGANMGTYDGGTIIFGFNTRSNWAADGTTHQSNLHPMVQPCFHVEAPNVEYYKFIDPLLPADYLAWLHLVQNNTYWASFPDCASYGAAFPPYDNSLYSITILPVPVYAFCAECTGCNPFDDILVFRLPALSFFDVVYTDGTDTFYLYNVESFHAVDVTITEDVTYSIISVTEVGGCAIHPVFSGDAVYDVEQNNPGVHTDILVCPNFGAIPLMMVLAGNPDPGGTWYPPLALGTHYLTSWGPGTYTYIFKHLNCPDDTASVTINHVDYSETTIEIGCDQNGTPTDITDDRIIVTLTVIANGFNDSYDVLVSSGTITPTVGYPNVPIVFTLSPGTATTNNLSITIQNVNGVICHLTFPIPAPGYCSDPCDHGFTATLDATDEDLCINDCSANDDPASLFIDLYGGYYPYEVDFRLTAPGHPVWNFTNIEVDIATEIEVCVGNVAAPVFDAVTGLLTVPQFLANSQITFSLTDVTDKYDCTAILNNPEHTFYIHALPMITTTSFEVCREFAKKVDLTQYAFDIHPFYDVTWYDGNPFLGGDELFNPTEVNLENVVSLWASVTDDYCQNAIQVGFVIRPSPRLNAIAPINVCEGNAVILNSIPIVDQGNSSAIYTFHPGLPYDSSNLLNPAFYLPADSTTIYLFATAGMCYDTMPIKINVVDYPDFTLEAQPCDLILNTYSVLFTSSADSIITSAGTIINNPSGQDSITGIPNNVNVSIQLLGPAGLCRDTIQFIAPNCNCPLIAQPVAPQSNFNICEGGPLPLLSVQDNPGFVFNWYSTPSGGTPLLQQSLTYQPVIPSSMNYYVETLDTINGCYSIRTQISIQVLPIAQLQTLNNPVLCETETLNFSTTIPAVLNGVAGSGQWYNLATNNPVSGTIQPQNGSAWYYLYTSVGNCMSSDTIDVTVNPIPTINVFNLICDDIQLEYQIQFTSDADVVLASTGILTQIAGTDSFLLSNIPFNTDIQFDLQYLATGCSASILQLAPDCSCPQLLQNNTTRLCSNPGIVDLSTFVGFGVSGNWQLVSTPPGANPATLIGSNFQGLNADPGSYNLIFIRSILLADCIDTATFQLTLNTSPFVNAGTNGSICAPDPISLSGTAGGSNVIYSWQENGTGSIANPNALNTTYTPTLADITSGAVNFTLTANDQTGFCPSASETITMTIDGSAYYILNAGTQTYCDTSNVQVDLDALISFGNTGGEWFFPDTVSAPVTGSSNINPSTIPAGNYTIFYTTTNANPPCTNDTVGVNLVIRNCLCPSVALSTPGQGACSNSATINLNSFLITTEAGSWSITARPNGSNSAIINGNNFVTNNSDAGIYTVRYTLTNPVAGCDDFAEIMIEVFATPSFQIASVECTADLQNWEAMVITTAGNVTSNQGNITSLGNDRYLITGLSLSNVLQLSASTGNGLCVNSITIPAPDCNCSLDISSVPNNVSLCPNESIVLTATVTGGKGNVTSYWINGTDTTFQNTINISLAGTYQFIAVDSLGCREEQLTDVVLYTEMVPDASAVDISCPGDKDGQIIIHQIVGGNAPFFISLNGGNMISFNTFPHIFSGLSAGNYQVSILDGFSCTISLNLIVGSVSTETLSLGPDRTILSGDSVQLNPVLSFVPDTFDWQGNLSLLNLNQLDNWIKPDKDETFVLTATDNKGCVYSDEINIRVLLHSSIYIPTIFSPNGDNINDKVIPMADPSVTMIEYFEIFSRWGELVYSAKNFAPNQSDTGWDGTFGGKKQSPGVFVYRLSALNKKGGTILQSGDITLMH